MKIDISENNLISNPTEWPADKWILFFRTYLAFLGAESMKEAKEICGLETQEIIMIVESFIMGLLYHDREISGPDEMMQRRKQFMRAVKGLESYAEIIKMEKIEFFEKTGDTILH